MTIEQEVERLLSHKYINEKGCWLWTRSKNRGYGVAWIGKRMYRMHRLSAYLFLNHPIDSELSVLHKCDVKACFNPEHLFIGTQGDNIRDCVEKGRYIGFKAGISKINSNKKECKHGHPFDEENTYVTKTGTRQCKICNKARLKTWRKQQCAFS